MALDAEHARHVVQLFTDVLANATKLATTAAGRIVRLMTNLDARQLRRQRRTLGWAALRIALGRRLKRFELNLDRRDIAIDGFLQQARLGWVELLATLAELVALQNRDFVGKLIDTRLPIDQLAVLVAHLRHERGRQRAKLFRI